MMSSTTAASRATPASIRSDWLSTSGISSGALTSKAWPAPREN